MAMLKIQDLKVNPGDDLTAERWNGLVELLARALEPPALVSPLVWNHGAIALAHDFQLYEAMTSANIPARVGNEWQSGSCAFLTVNETGVESAMPGFPAFVGWNYTGTQINSGTRVWVAWAYEKWVILFGDCSGV